MGPLKNGKPRRGRICCLAALAGLLFIFIVGAFFYEYLQNPSFRSLMEETIRTRTGQVIHLGTVAYDPERGIILKDFFWGERDKVGVSLFLPYAEIGITWDGIRKREIKTLHLLNPEMNLPLTGKKTDKPRTETSTLPFRILQGSIEGGTLTLHWRKAAPLTIDAIDLTLSEDNDGNHSRFEGRGVLRETKTPLTLKGVIDPKDLTLREAHLRTGWSDLAILPTLMPVPDPTLTMDGSLKIEADLQQGEAGPSGTVKSEFRDPVLLKNETPLFQSTAGNVYLHFAKTGTGNLHLRTTIDAVSLQYTTKELTVTSGKTTRITAEGIYPAEGNRIDGLHLKAELPGLGNFYLSGNLSALSTNDPTLDLILRGEGISLEEIQNHLSGPALRPLQGLKIRGTMTAQARITGPMQEPVMEGNLRIAGGRFNLPGRATGPLRANAAFRYDKKGVTLPDFTITSRDLGRARGNLSFSPGPQRKLSMDWTQDSLSPARLKARFPGVFSGLKGTELHGSGVLRTTLTMTGRTGKPSVIRGRSHLQITGGGFSSSDGNRMGEGINLNLSTQYDFSLPLKQLRFSADGAARDFELLLGGFYGNFKDRPLFLSLQGLYRPDKNELHLQSANLSLERIGTLHASGKISRLGTKPRFDLQGRTTAVALGPLFDFFLRETFQESRPGLSRLEVEGTTGLDFRVSGTKDRFTADGTVTISGMNLHGSRPSTSLEGMELHLPFSLHTDGKAFENSPEEYGTLSIDRLDWDGAEIDHLTARPLIEDNRLLFKEAVALPLFGGTITLKDILYSNLLRKDRTLTLAVDIDDLNLAEGSVALKFPPFSGRVTGTIPQVRLEGRRLTTQGEILLHLFGGEVRIDKISGEDLFTPVPSLHASIKLRKIDLRQLTGTFEFGKISGILEGEIRDLVLTRGQPERFEARIETVPTKGVPQKISVEALEKISILGSGTSPTLFGRGIYQLFKEYRYSRMGFRSTLKNDKFILHGIERFGNRGYLVKGSLLPPKVNVVNYTQDISFREMVKRLRRIQTSGKAKKGADE